MSSFDSQPGSDDHLAKNTETSDGRGFTEVWKKRAMDFVKVDASKNASMLVALEARAPNMLP